MKLLLISVLAFAPAVLSAGVIESFDNCDASAYTVVGGFGSPAATAGAAHDGACGLPTSGFTYLWAYRDDAAVQVAQGDTISAWVRLESVATGRAYFGFGASSAGTLSFILAPNTGELMFQENANYSQYNIIATTPQSYLVDHWYREEVIWGAGGSLTGNLYDSDGTTLLNSLSASSTLYSSGGIAFRGFDGAKDFDTISVGGDAPEPGTYGLMGIALSGLFAICRRRKSLRA
jgi:hypothetical protein